MWDAFYLYVRRSPDEGPECHQELNKQCCRVGLRMRMRLNSADDFTSETVVSGLVQRRRPFGLGLTGAIPLFALTRSIFRVFGLPIPPPLPEYAGSSGSYRDTDLAISRTGLAGVTILDGRAYSHHASDPLSDKHSHDAFDVYRILVHSKDMRNAIKAAAEEFGIDRREPSIGEAPGCEDRVILVRGDTLRVKPIRWLYCLVGLPPPLGGQVSGDLDPGDFDANDEHLWLTEDGACVVIDSPPDSPRFTGFHVLLLY